MQRDSGQAAEFLFPPPNGTGSLLPGSSVIQTYCRDLASLPTQHVRLTDPGDPKEQDLEEPKKRKGGWPKGKKRKPPRDLAVPRAPTTGYTIFLNEQRSQLRAQHPSLPFPEITKMLAAQWAHLPQEKKQRYVCEADEDKQRYIRELQAYQNSEAYLAFLRRRAALKVQARCGAPGYEFEGKGLDFSAVDADENDDLYCRTCRQFFSSLHNKREHLLGKQHLQNLTGEFEKDSAECLKHLELLEGEEGQNLNKGDSEEEAEYPDPLLLGGLIPEKGFASFDLCFLQEFIFKLLQIKESELRELRKTLERAQAEQEALQRQLLEFQNRQQWLEVELASLKTYGVILEKEFENLNTVIMLPHFGLRVMDTGGTVYPVFFPLFIGSFQRFCPLLDGGLLGSGQPVGVDDKPLMFLWTVTNELEKSCRDAGGGVSAPRLAGARRAAGSQRWAAGAIRVSLQPSELKERVGSKDEGTCMRALSHFQLFTTPQEAARQAPLSMAFSQQEFQSSLPFPPSKIPIFGLEIKETHLIHFQRASKLPIDK